MSTTIPTVVVPPPAPPRTPLPVYEEGVLDPDGLPPPHPLHGRVHYALHIDW